MSSKQIPSLLRPEPKQFSSAELVAELRYLVLSEELSRTAIVVLEQAADRLEEQSNRSLGSSKSIDEIMNGH